jgi:fructose-1-phosphate kinase PfkB-like protein
VDPPEKLIDAMDFERFVLTGSIPAGAPEDSYNGWILVDGEEQMRIPVVLQVSGKG